ARTTWIRCCGAIRSPSTGRAAGSTSTPARKPVPTTPATRSSGADHAAAPSGRLDGSSVLLHQRPRRRGPPRHPPSAVRRRGPGPAPARRRTARARALAVPARRRGPHRPARRARGAARAAGRARAGGRDPERVPLPRIPGRGREVPRLHPRLGRPGAAAPHARARPDPRRAAAGRRLRGHDLDPAPRLADRVDEREGGGGAGQPRRGRPGPARAGEPYRQGDPAGPRARAGLHRRDDVPGERPAGRRGPRPPRPLHGRLPHGRGVRGARGGRRRRAADREAPGVVRPGGAAGGAAGAGRVRRAPLPPPDALRQRVRRRPGRGPGRRAARGRELARALPRPAARRAAPAAHHQRPLPAAPAGDAARRGAPADQARRGGDLHLARAARRAGRHRGRHRRRARLDARAARRPRPEGDVMAPLIVVNVVGLTPRLLAHMPNVAKAGSAATLRPVLPAVTCSMQATLLTGSMPRDHGIVGNGWYFRDLGEVLLWRQHNALIQGDQLWTAAPGLRTANVCWWYAMGAPSDLLVTPRPVYHADGRKSPDCYTRPPSLHDDLEAALGPFPLFTYWGPTAGIASSEWIIAAARRILARERPDLLLVYVPHLDYDLQRYGPDGPEAVAAARAVDAALAPLLAEEAEVVVLSEYGITPASRPVDINRALR